MKIITNVLLFVIVVGIVGCQKEHDSRIHLGENVGSHSLVDNLVTRPITHAFSALIGEGIEINQATLKRNDTGFLELQVDGYNRSHQAKRFRYRVEWLDESGFLIQSKTSVWLPMSAMGKTPFSIQVVAPTPNATNFRMDTRK